MLHTNKCPNCGSTNIDRQMRCSYCGSTLEKRIDGSLSFLATLAYTCEKCGTASKRDEPFCQKCGNDLAFTCPYCGEMHAKDTVFCSKTGRDIRILKLFDAVRKRDISRTRLILEEEPSLVSAKDEHGATPAHIAVATDQLEILNMLLSNSADITIPDKNGMTPLHLAVRTNHVNMVRFLLDMGIDVNPRCSDSNLIRGMNYLFSNVTPLHQASSLGNSEIVQLLLSKGADYGVKAVNTYNNNTVTVKEAAKLNRHTELVKYFEEYEEIISGKHPRVPARVYRRYAALLAFFGSSIGLHRFYLSSMWGIAYILFFWTGIPWFIGMIEGFVFLLTPREKFKNKYNKLLPEEAPDRWSSGPLKTWMVVLALIIAWNYFFWVVFLGWAETKHVSYREFALTNSTGPYEPGKMLTTPEIYAPDKKQYAYTKTQTRDLNDPNISSTVNLVRSTVTIGNKDTGKNSERIILPSQGASETGIVYKILDWSSDSQKLIIAGYTIPEEREKPEFLLYLYDISKNELLQVSDEQSNQFAEKTRLQEPFAGWLDENPVIYLVDRDAVQWAPLSLKWKLQENRLEKLDNYPENLNHFATIHELEKEKITPYDSWEDISPSEAP